jgi:hypothetical protein
VNTHILMLSKLSSFWCREGTSAGCPRNYGVIEKCRRTTFFYLIRFPPLVRLALTVHTTIVLPILTNADGCTESWLFPARLPHLRNIASASAVIAVTAVAVHDTSRRQSRESIAMGGMALAFLLSSHLSASTLSPGQNLSSNEKAVTEFAPRKLIFPQDAIDAVSGIINILRLSYDRGFVRCNLTLFLDTMLLWNGDCRIHNNSAFVAVDFLRLHSL